MQIANKIWFTDPVSQNFIELTQGKQQEKQF